MALPIICLTNGRRECITRTISSAIEHLSGVLHMVIVDTSGDPEYGQWLEDEFIGGPSHTGVLHIEGSGGYWQAMKAVWRYALYLLDFDGTDAAFFLEDDFVFNVDVDLNDLHEVLNDRPYLTQIALLRQPWWPNEHEHGGLIPALEAQGQQFTEQTDGQRTWVEHRACFTGNPSLIPQRTFSRQWPEGAWSESRFGRELFSNPAARGAYWGHRTDAPRVEHIGGVRVGHDY